MALLLAINAGMFVVELGVGWLAQSMGLIADSLDMLADAGVGVILAGALVMLTGSAWPDLVIGLAICGLVVRGGVRILRQTRASYAGPGGRAAAQPSRAP